jgi:hypothetical protein
LSRDEQPPIYRYQLRRDDARFLVTKRLLASSALLEEKN